MHIKAIPVGQLETNCYVVTDEETLECAVIDPGDESNTILDYIEDNHLKCRVILITHGHYDHVGAVLPVMEETGATVYINAEDSNLTPGSEGMKFPLPEGGKFYDEGDEVKVGSLTFRVMRTPGHTPGGVTLICGDAVFCGDTLFAGSCGRADLPGGDMDEELRSIKRICMLPGDYEVYPGHMDATTLERERNYNYYCRQAMGLK
jgi:hydroxyacylglutathione hydrolase